MESAGKECSEMINVYFWNLLSHLFLNLTTIWSVFSFLGYGRPCKQFCPEYCCYLCKITLKDCMIVDFLSLISFCIFLSRIWRSFQLYLKVFVNRYWWHFSQSTYKRSTNSKISTTNFIFFIVIFWQIIEILF